MKLNWGYKIALFYMVFVAGIIFLVVQSSRQRIDLVTADYYGEEIRYQERINETKRADALSASVDVTVAQDILTLTFPTEFRGKKIEGTVTLYCPADEQKDIVRTISTDNNKMKISLPEQNKGLHQLKVKWKVDGLAYYFEQNITIN
jgi:hypothetical protein